MCSLNQEELFRRIKTAIPFNNCATGKVVAAIIKACVFVCDEQRNGAAYIQHYRSIRTELMGLLELLNEPKLIKRETRRASLLEQEIGPSSKERRQSLQVRRAKASAIAYRLIGMRLDYLSGLLLSDDDSGEPRSSPANPLYAEDKIIQYLLIRVIIYNLCLYGDDYSESAVKLLTLMRKSHLLLDERSRPCDQSDRDWMLARFDEAEQLYREIENILGYDEHCCDMTGEFDLAFFMLEAEQSVLRSGYDNSQADAFSRTMRLVESSNMQISAIGPIWLESYIYLRELRVLGIPHNAKDHLAFLNEFCCDYMWAMFFKLVGDCRASSLVNHDYFLRGVGGAIGYYCSRTNSLVTSEPLCDEDLSLELIGSMRKAASNYEQICESYSYVSPGDGIKRQVAINIAAVCSMYLKEENNKDALHEAMVYFGAESFFRLFVVFALCYQLKPKGEETARILYRYYLNYVAWGNENFTPSTERLKPKEIILKLKGLSKGLLEEIGNC